MNSKMNTKRRSVCVGCGKRLSAIIASGKIRWLPSQVDDEGLYCEDCYEKHAKPKNNKVKRSK